MGKRFITGLGVSLVLITLWSLLGYVAWNPYLELASHFRLQYFVLSLLVLAGLTLARAKRWLLIALFCLTVQAAELLPWYLPANPMPSASIPNLRILLTNVYVRNQSHDKVLQLVAAEDPDIAVFMEVDYRWSQALQALRSRWPFSFAASEDLTIYSRLPLEQATLFGPSNAPGLFTSVTVSGQPISLVVAHPLPPIPRLFTARNAELERAIQYIRQQRQSRSPTILVGDLNLTMWSPYYRKLEQQTGLRNARKGFGLIPTWPAPTPYASTAKILAWLKPFLWIPIDHSLVSPEIQVISFRAGTPIDSDHLPIITDLHIPAIRPTNPSETRSGGELG